MIKFLALFLLFPLLSFTQTELELHLNARNAKTLDLFDYYSKFRIKTIKDSVIALSAMINYERDNEIEYYSYSGKIGVKYGSFEYYKDTEKGIEYLSTSLFLPISKWLDIGYNYLIMDKDFNSIYIGIKWKWIKANLSFFEKIRKFVLSANPKIPITDNLKIGFGCEVIYIDDKIKWNNGLILNYKF